MTNKEKLKEMMQTTARNEQRVREYIERKEAEATHRTIEIYARAVYESMDDLAGGNKERRDELIEVLFNTVKAMG